MRKNKETIVSAVAVRTGLGRMATEEVIDAFLSNIIYEVESGNAVSIKDFGVFEPVSKAKRPGRNINTGTSVDIPAHIEPRFRPSKYFKEVVYKNIE